MILKRAFPSVTTFRLALLCLLSAVATPLRANTPDLNATELYLQCVPYARTVSGIGIYGDAHSWWEQADGRFSRGNTPRKGAVMAFKPHGAMQLGHVATVTRIVDERTVLIDHANWSPFNGRRGQIERNVIVKDVSDNNDWSSVRVWYAPINGLGATSYPLFGFIYGDGKLRSYDGPIRTYDHALLSAPKSAPRLDYAGGVLAMAEWTPPHNPQRLASSSPRPTGRLNELQAVVAHLR